MSQYRSCPNGCSSRRQTIFSLVGAHPKADALDVVVVIEDGVLAGGDGVGGDGAAVEYAIAVPEHLHALAKVLEALRLCVHRAPAVGCPAHAPAP